MRALQQPVAASYSAQLVLVGSVIESMQKNSISGIVTIAFVHIFCFWSFLVVSLVITVKALGPVVRVVTTVIAIHATSTQIKALSLSQLCLSYQTYIRPQVATSHVIQ
jgi:hypothetical protein